jgi:phosphoribosylaminoimidazole-succinocarboxamide synthase
VYSPEQLSLTSSDFKFKSQHSRYQGKVRDVYDIGQLLIMIATDRISAFDHILPRPIPYKGQVLNQIAAFYLDSVKDICPVWYKNSPDPNVTIGYKCNPIPLEIVVRGYLAGHSWRLYAEGKPAICGVPFEKDLKQNQPFSEPIITPTTKAKSGHDEDISYESILEKEIVSESLLNRIYKTALELFERGSQMSDEKGLILVDTKYEFGLLNDELILMDEIHTPDSSRYFEKAPYAEKLEKNEAQVQLSKEFVREWLMAHGFQGKEDQMIPEMSDGFVWMVSERYIELYERISGKGFQKPDPQIPIIERIRTNLSQFF